MKTQNRNSNFTIKNIGKAFVAFLFIIFTSTALFAEDVEVIGNITEIGIDYLMVQDLTFFVDQNSVFKDDDGNTVAFTFFQLNDLVEVKANSLGNGTFIATRVRIEDGPNNQTEVEVTGYVTNIGSNSFIINSNTFFVDENTEFRARHGNSFSFEQIEVGMLLEVRVISQPNGNLLAIRVKKEDDNNQHGNEIEVQGLIETKNSSSIVVTTKEFFVNSSTVIRNSNGIPIHFEDLNTGDKVEVKAFRQQDGTYIAVRIKLEDLPEHEIEFTAQIENTDGAEITIQGIVFSTDSNTLFLDHNRLPITIDLLEVGMWVEVKGINQPDGSYYASRIKIEDFVQSEIELKGKITEITNSYLIVNDITFNVDINTLVLDHSNNPISYSSLQVGQIVEVKGVKSGLNIAVTTSIKIEDIEDIEIFGRIATKNSNSIEINGLIFFVNKNTVYLNHTGQPITFYDLSIDQFVEVKLIVTLDGTLLAIRIKIDDSMSFSKVDGFISNINGPSVQLPTGIYTITGQTIAIDNNYNQISTNQFSNGQQVIIWALTAGSNNKTALQIQSKNSSVLEVNEPRSVVDEFRLEQNYPNPFNPSTTISFKLNSEQFVSLKIYNATGEEVRTLINENLDAGLYNINFSANDLSSGLYLYKLESKDQFQVRKMMLIK